MSSKKMRHAKRLGKAYGRRFWDEMSQEAFVECFVPTFVWPVTEVEATPEPPTTCLRMFVRETVDEFEGTVSGKGVKFVRKMHSTVAMVRRSCPHVDGKPRTTAMGPVKVAFHDPALCPQGKGRLVRIQDKDHTLAVPDGKGGFVDPTDNVPVVVMESPFGEQNPAPYGCGAPIV